MAQCAHCDATILFGGHRRGEYRFCSPRCLMAARPSLLAEEVAGDVKDELAQTGDDVLILAEELQQQRAAMNELQERVDFLERALAQLREAALKSPRGTG